MFNLKFDTDDDTFSVHPWIEASRILSEVSEALEDGYVEGVIRDGNGNTVGSWSFERDED